MKTRRGKSCGVTVKVRISGWQTLCFCGIFVTWRLKLGLHWEMVYLGDAYPIEHDFPLTKTRTAWKIQPKAWAPKSILLFCSNVKALSTWTWLGRGWGAKEGGTHHESQFTLWLFNAYIFVNVKETGIQGTDSLAPYILQRWLILTRCTQSCN